MRSKDKAEVEPAKSRPMEVYSLPRSAPQSAGFSRSGEDRRESTVRSGEAPGRGEDIGRRRSTPPVVEETAGAFVTARATRTRVNQWARSLRHQGRTMRRVGTRCEPPGQEGTCTKASVTQIAAKPLGLYVGERARRKPKGEKWESWKKLFQRKASSS